jgi:Carboxypeptidase regulatory-like domain
MEVDMRKIKSVEVFALADYLLAFGLMVLAPGLARAQVDTGAISGIVQDQTAGVIPKAQVTLSNQGTGLALSTMTNSAGQYVFTPIRIGNYTVSVKYAGFKRSTHTNITVNLRQTVTVNFTLVPGQVTQTVEVSAAPPQLQTTNAEVGQVVGQRDVNDLPLNGRNYTFLAQLSAGVTVSQQDNRGEAASGTFASNGLRPAQNDYLLDGIDNNNDEVDLLNGLVPEGHHRFTIFYTGIERLASKITTAAGVDVGSIGWAVVGLEGKP